MYENIARIGSCVLAVLWPCSAVQAEDDICHIDDLGDLTPGELKTKISLMHIWQGAVGGVNTKNADRITSLYDLDFYYLIHGEKTKDRNGDYALLAVSTQAAFGRGINDSKVGSFFEINENAKGDIGLIADKVFVEFTAFDRVLKFNVGKMDLLDYFDCSAVASDEKEQFIAYPFYHNPAIPFPGKGLAVRAFWQTGDFWYAQAAVADAQGDKRETGFNTAFHDEDYFFSVAEVGIRPNLFHKSGTYRFLTWL